MITKQRIEEKRQKRLGLYYLIQEDDWERDANKVAKAVKYTQNTGLGNTLEKTKARAKLTKMSLEALTRGNFLYLKSKGYTNDEIIKSVNVTNWVMCAWVKGNNLLHSAVKEELGKKRKFSEKDKKLPIIKNAE